MRLLWQTRRAVVVVVEAALKISTRDPLLCLLLCASCLLRHLAVVVIMLIFLVSVFI